MKRLFIFIPLFWAVLLFAQPAWYSSQPAGSQEFYGRGAVKSKDKTEAMEAAIQGALSDISRQIYSDVQASVYTSEYEGSGYSSSFVKEVQVESNVALCGYRKINEEYIKGTYYVLLGVSRERLISHYQNMIKTQTDEVISSYDANLKLFKDKNYAAALKGFQQLRGKLTDLAVYTRVFSALYQGNLQQALPRLEKIPALGVVDSQIAQIKGNPIQGFNELADDLIDQFPPEFKKPLDFQISYMEWMNTGFVSEFSEGFTEQLAVRLERSLNWKRITGGYGKPQILVGGQLFAEGDRINVIIRCVGKYNQTFSVQLSPNTIAHFGIESIKPAGLEQALATQKIMVEKAVQSGQLHVWVRFPQYDKTTAMFKYGDQTNILVKANKPCYLTAINVESSGDWNVLEQNLRISEENVGEWISLTSRFKVVEPAGIEQLLVQAALKPMPYYKVRTVRVDGGTKNISVGEKEELAKTRGLVALDSDDDEYTESYLTWTVLAK